MKMHPRDLRDLSLYEFHCLAVGSAKASGAEESIPAPTDAEHDALVAKFVKR